MTLNIEQALGIKGGQAVAFLGLDRDLSALFSIATQISRPCVIASLGGLDPRITALADAHVILDGAEGISGDDLTGHHTILVTGQPADDDLLSGLREESLQVVHSVCRENDSVLLINVDTTQGTAVEGREPLPGWVNHAVILAGLKRFDHFIPSPQIDEQLSADEFISRLSQIEDQNQGLMEIDQISLFLLGADDDLMKARGAKIARELVDDFNRVLIGSLQPENSGVVVDSVHSRITGVVLAAGGSDRLGRPKQLLSWQGIPFVQQVALNALEADLSPLCVVTGACHEEVEAALAGLPVEVVYNPDWEQGQSTSMKTGLRSLPKRCGGVMLLLSDQPHITPHLIRGLVESYARNRAPITAPLVSGQRGNPVLFGCETFEALSKITGDVGGRPLFKTFDIDWLPWIDARILLDVDDEEDLETLRRAYYLTD